MKILKILTKLFLTFIILLSLYVAYLYIQNPVVVSRLGSVIMGNNPGIAESVESNNAFPIKKATVKSISDESIQSAIEFSQATGSHALLIYH